ncbi:DegQ family serine endoprotease [Marinimicrococcus flavescens]|uniref:Probable periplasmic serine endoprotease DegP-like n=1 Tax=Marinimicrococcus flavescens TaxID=3031815 RepID=A0AAP4D7B1_9PROT|nr:DegQ family serine endoprotease [Marinimicrococcus flavescens]
MTFPVHASAGRRRLSRLGMASALTLALVGGAPAWAQPGSVTEQLRSHGPTDFSSSYAELVEAVLPAVVNVSVERTKQVGGPGAGPMADPEMRRFFERYFGQPPQQAPREELLRGEGSGFIVSADGLIVTNAHVVGGADRITVTLQDGTTLEASLKGIDEKTDLALIEIKADKTLPFVEFGDSSKVKVGDKVVAVGNPFGLGGTVTAGIVSATGRELGSGPYDDFIQVDAPINRGNSGGPTFNLDGQVVGVNSMIFSPSGGSVGIGFAISANLAQSIVDDLKDDGEVRRGWLGVSIQEVTPDIAEGLGLEEAAGALISKVEPGSPADKAGLASGQVILDFAGTKIERLRQLTRAVAEAEPAKPAEVTVWADGGRKTVEVEVGTMKKAEQVAAAEEAAEPQKARLGIALAEVTPQMRAQLGLEGGRGVLVSGVQADKPAAEKGVQAGDVILAIGGKDVTSPAEAASAIKEAEENGKKVALLLVYRDGAQIFMAVPFAQS